MSAALLPAALGLSAGLFLGWLLGWLQARARAARRLAVAEAALAQEVALGRERVTSREARIADLERRLGDGEQMLERTRAEASGLERREAELEARLESERQAQGERLRLLEQAESRLGDSFRALGSEALSRNNEAFLSLARATLAAEQAEGRGDLERRERATAALLQPLSLALERLDAQLATVEGSRRQAYGQLTEQVQALLAAEGELRQQTGQLVRALGSSNVRGRWGELQLERVVEMAGMVEHCDFQRQDRAVHEDGSLRPDLVVKLPGGRNLVVDAKAPLLAYLEAVDAPDEATRAAKLKEHARQVRASLNRLGQKAYFEQFRPSPEFVVLFLPGECFLGPALEQDPALLEDAMRRGVVIATPMTLVALLKAVAYSWRQERAAASAEQVGRLGRELHERARAFTGHLADVGGALDGAVGAYNRAVGSLESRLLPVLRRFRDLGVGGGEEVEVEPLGRAARRPQAAAPEDEGGEPGAAGTDEPVR